MPVQKCTEEGKNGWRWGSSGKCYVYSTGDKTASGKAKNLAYKQGAAITGGKMTEAGGDRTYASWRNMIQRCTNPKAPNYEWYGKKGISVSKRWLNSYDDFLKDMGTRPAGKTMHRKNGKGNYNKANCIWATPKQHNESEIDMKVKLLHKFIDIIDNWDENPFQEVAEAQIDTSTHTIKNVCVFGTRHSKNGYDYENPAIDKLSLLTEGAKFFINHPSKSETKDRDGVRDIRDWAGVYTAPRKEGEDKVFADLKVRPAFWELVKDVAIMKPPGVGNSINSRVKVFKDEKGKEHIVDIDVLKSIDLVASAATTQNLFESHEMENEEMNIEEIIEQIVNEEEGETQENITYQLIRDISDGLLKDRIKEREKARKINDLQWKSGDVIEEILKDKTKDMKAKKTEISAVLDDLESLINAVLAGKESTRTILNTKKEEDEMKIDELTLEILMNERPDLAKMIQDSVKQDEEISTIKKEHTELKTRMEALETELVESKSQLEAITKERDELKGKLDEYETKEAGAKKEALISDKVAELKIPKEVITDVFKTSLMGMEEAEIVESLEDRKEIFLKGQKVVKGAGDEYTIPANEKLTDEELDKKKEAASKSVKEALGR